MNSPKFLTPEEVSELFLIPRRTIQSLVRNKRIPGFKIGKRWRFRKEDIEQWIEIRNLIKKEF